MVSVLARKAICPPDGDLCAIGDPDQAIYSFRGADVGFFLRFTEDYPAARTVTLRNTGTGDLWILDVSVELPYALVGFPVNYATGISHSRMEELDGLLALSAEVLPRYLLRTVETLEEEDLAFDYGYVYRVEGGVGPRKG